MALISLNSRAQVGRVATTGGDGGQIVIRLFDINGNLQNTAFHFTGYKQ